MRRSKKQASNAPVAVSTPLAALELTPPVDPDPLDVVRLHNVVATANFGCPINLERLACSAYGNFNPRTFAAVNLRLNSPRATALVFSSGRIVCTGTASEYAALTALSVFLKMVQAVAPEARIVTRTIQNLVSVGNLGGHVRLDDLASAMLLSAHFDPEIFPGLRLKLRAPPAKVLVFCKGKCVLTGCKNRDEVARAWAAVRIITRPFICDPGTQMTHGTMAANRIAKRKGRII
jgi:transcription initiation factor TFIID TATA-box-binding protein